MVYVYKNTNKWKGQIFAKKINKNMSTVRIWTQTKNMSTVLIWTQTMVSKIKSHLRINHWNRVVLNLVYGHFQQPK